MKHFEHTRLHVVEDRYGRLYEEEGEDGRYVLAVDAICREAVLNGRIRELERQLARSQSRA